MKEWTASEMARKSNLNITPKQRAARRANALKALKARLLRRSLQTAQNTPNIVSK